MCYSVRAHKLLSRLKSNTVKMYSGVAELSMLHHMMHFLLRNTKRISRQRNLSRHTQSLVQTKVGKKTQHHFNPIKTNLNSFDYIKRSRCDVVARFFLMTLPCRSSALRLPDLPLTSNFALKCHFQSTFQTHTQFKVHSLPLKPPL